MRARSLGVKSCPSCAAIVRCTARASRFHTQVANALATSPEERTRSSKSRRDTARPKVRTVVGAFSRACSIDSGSAPPVASEGLVTDFKPTGRSSKVRREPAATRPSRPEPSSIIRHHIAAAGRQARTRASITEPDCHGPVIGNPGRVDSVRRDSAKQAGHFGPPNVVDQNLQSRLCAARFGAGNVGERIFLQLELLESNRSVAISQDFVSNLFAVARERNIAKQHSRVRAELERQLGLKCDGEIVLNGGPSSPRHDQESGTNDQHDHIREGRSRIGAFKRRLQQALALFRLLGAELSVTVRGPMGPKVTESSRRELVMAGNTGRSPERSASIRNAPGETKPSSPAVVGSAEVGPKLSAVPVLL